MTTNSPRKSGAGKIFSKEKNKCDTFKEGNANHQDNLYFKYEPSTMESTSMHFPSSSRAYNASTNQAKELEKMLLNTVARGEGNSCLVIGTIFFEIQFFVESIIKNLSSQQAFFTVRLDGSVHTDDRIAISEMARQLEVKISLPDDGLKRTFADSFATLLGTLQHINLNEQYQFSEPGLHFHNTPIIILLRDVDCFAQMPRQTLLYNLLDMTQSPITPMAVVATSGRLDCAELFEKRVKSRFSNRLIYVPRRKQGPSPNNKPIYTSEMNSNDAPQVKVTHKVLGESTVKLSGHHSMVHLMPIGGDKEGNRFISGEDSNLRVIENSLYLLESLSELEVSLLCCAARLEAKDNDSVTFDKCFAEYSALVSVGRVTASEFGASATTFSKQRKCVLAGAWANLVSMRLLSSKSVDSVPSRQKWMACQVTLNELRRINTQPALQKWLKL